MLQCLIFKILGHCRFFYFLQNLHSCLDCTDKFCWWACNCLGCLRETNSWSKLVGQAYRAAWFCLAQPLNHCSWLTISQFELIVGRVIPKGMCFWLISFFYVIMDIFPYFEQSQNLYNGLALQGRQWLPGPPSSLCRVKTVSQSQLSFGL